jgi:hypothetical protein
MPENNDNPNGEFGYGNPPKDTRFGKGVSGNPSGRPRGVRNWATELYRVAREKTVINDNGESKTVTNREAIMNQLKNKAKSGDLAAMRLYFDLEFKAEARFSDSPKVRIDKVGQIPNGKGGTVSDPDVYLVPNPIHARVAVAMVKLIYGVDLAGC